jgi:hypothetical protein
VLPGPSGLVAAISFGGFFTLGGKKRIVTTLQKIVHISRHLKGVSWDFASSIKKPTLKRVAEKSAFLQKGQTVGVFSRLALN